tara:strand:- start:2342 stop:2746 length:405 start_codon:yes stop_codon:yes gene_type:complete
MSTSHPYNVGINNVGSYQASGSPYCSGSTSHANGTQVQYDFPRITRSITVTNNGAPAGPAIRVHFNGTTEGDVIAGVHFVTLSGSMASQRFEVKTDKIFISNASGVAASYSIAAEITSIPVTSMFILTGSGLTD